MSKTKREGVIRLSLFIILTALATSLQANSWVTGFISLAAIYSLVTGVYRLTRKK
ncbi:hypothetical protein [Paenibacillus odorifer]|uniref:hypothetical protein n=1 Tax=Paenibacillus odorifer TaxID=189426 RepID=UPI0015C33FCE|nr:hypothetical protein [Paenibacillus odorifer]